MTTYDLFYDIELLLLADRCSYNYGQSDILKLFFISIVQLSSVSCCIIGTNWFQFNNKGGYPGYRQPEKDMQWLSGLFW